jgi:hypothetical protein
MCLPSEHTVFSVLEPASGFAADKEFSPGEQSFGLMVDVLSVLMEENWSMLVGGIFKMKKFDKSCI